MGDMRRCIQHETEKSICSDIACSSFHYNERSDDMGRAGGQPCAYCDSNANPGPNAHSDTKAYPYRYPDAKA